MPGSMPGAYATEKPLSPKVVNEHMRDHLYEKTPWILSMASQLNGGNGATETAEYAGSALVGEVIKDETIWSCTTCKACEEPARCSSILSIDLWKCADTWFWKKAVFLQN